MPTDLIRRARPARYDRRPSRLRFAVGVVLGAPLVAAMLIAWAALAVVYVLFSILAA